MIWRSKKTRVPQPRVVAATRAQEQNEFAPAAVIAALACALLLCGAVRSTKIETAEGGLAREHQLVKAFAHGGLRLADPPTPPDPATFDNPEEAAEALEKFAKLEAEAPKIKYVVHVGAVDPCPT